MSNSKKKTQKSPFYDGLFKDIYSKIEYALELIRAKLSIEEYDLFDWSGLRLERDSFDGGLLSDLLFSVPLKDSPDIRIPFFILFEHKSLYSPKVLIQVLGYMIKIIKSYSKLMKKTCFPPMVVILFSHGKKMNKDVLRLQDLLPKEWLELKAKEKGKGPFSSLSKDMLDFALRVFDVHDPKLYQDFKNWKTHMALSLFQDKTLLTSNDEKVLEKELMELFGKLKGINSMEDQDILLSGVYDYLSRRNPKIDLTFFRRCLMLVSEDDEDLIKVEGGQMGYVPMMERGLAEGLAKGMEKGMEKGRMEGMKRGIEKGIERGIEKGIERGIEKGQEKIISQLLKANMSVEQICHITDLSKQEILEIQKKTRA